MVDSPQVAGKGESMNWGFSPWCEKLMSRIMGLVMLQLSVSHWLRFEEDASSPF